MMPPERAETARSLLLGYNRCTRISADPAVEGLKIVLRVVMPAFGRMVLWLLPFWAPLAGTVTAAPPPERRLPASTRAVVFAPNAAAALATWRKTQFGVLANDPLLQPVIADLMRQVEHGAALPGLLSATWPELSALASDGPASVAAVPAGGRTATVALLDVTGKAGKRNAFLRKIAVYAIEHKGRLKLEPVGAESVMALALPANHGAAATTLYLQFKDDCLIIADDAAAIADVFARWARGADGFDSMKAFQTVRDRSRFPDGGPADLVWFADPFGHAAANKGLVARLADLGLTGVTAVGGATRLGGDPLDMHSRVAVLAPRKDKLMKLLEFPNRAVAAPPEWVPADATAYGTFQWDMHELLPSIGMLFDRESGKAGDFQAVVRALRDEPDGPRINLQRDVIDQLTGRVDLLTDCPDPGRGHRAVVAFETRDEKALAHAIAELLRGERGVTSRSLAGHTVWEMKFQPKYPADVEAVLPVAVSLAVARKHLFVADDAGLLEAVLRAAPGRKRLAGETDFQVVNTELDKLGLVKTSARLFARPAQLIRWSHEPARTGSPAPGQSSFARLLRGVLDRATANAIMKLDVTKLPPFEHVQDRLTPFGGAVVTLPDGWIITAISLKSVPAANRPSP
jgi:hypothetical protein